MHQFIASQTEMAYDWEFLQLYVFFSIAILSWIKW